MLMDHMGFILVGLLLLSFVANSGSSHSPIITAVMDDNVTLANEMVCGGIGKWYVKKGDKYRDVIICGPKQENCSVEPRFQNRAEPRGTSLNVNPVLSDDDGFYIYSCDDQDIWTIILRLEAKASTAVIAAGGDVFIRLCSLDQVKLHFTPMANSTAETMFMVDNGKAFIDLQAPRHMMLTVKNITAVLSGVMQSGVITGLDSHTDKRLFEVNVTVTRSSADQGTGHRRQWMSVCVPLSVIIIPTCIAVLCFLIYTPRLKQKFWNNPPDALEGVSNESEYAMHSLKQGEDSEGTNLKSQDCVGTPNISGVCKQNGQTEGNGELFVEE